MKRLLGFLSVLITLVGCHPAGSCLDTAPQSRLVAIDSLMQSQPDSALSVLLDEPMDDPYYQLLLSEALYKNDYAQANRRELLTTMAYFDSIGDPFLSARCHYMNGAGYYEMDSVVPACAEYLKALEIMEEHFEEKDLVGFKAKFMALSYSRLCELFTNQYLHIQAVEVAQKAYQLYKKNGYMSWQSAWALNMIGSNYHMIGQLDSATAYYQKAFATPIDTSCLLYRDIREQLALIGYETGDVPEKQLCQLKHLLSQAKTDNELYARCLAVGEVFYRETEFDSAKFYLEKIFLGDACVSIKKQAAELLISIYRNKEEFIKATPYTNYLVSFANLNENQGYIKSQLVDSYQNHEQKKKENLNQLQLGKNHKQVFWILFVIAFFLFFIVALYYLRTKQLKKERLEHDMKRAALAGRLKQSNAALKKERENRTTVSILPNNIKDPELVFEEEPICRHIISVSYDKKNPIKSNIPISSYANIALTRSQKARLKEAANRHYGQLFNYLKTHFPELKERDLFYCYLCLLGLDNTKIAAMTQLSYRTVWEREKRLQRIFQTDESIPSVLYGFLIN